MAFFSLNILLLLTLIAKELLVLNAEALVLLMFVLFIIVITHQLKTDTNEFFNTHNDNLKKEYYNQRTECILALKKIKETYTKELTLIEFVKKYISFYQKIMWASNIYTKKKLKKTTTKQILEQLKKIELQEQLQLQNLQKSIISTVPKQIKIYFHSKSENEKENILDTQIQHLELN